VIGARGALLALLAAVIGLRALRRRGTPRQAVEQLAERRPGQRRGGRTVAEWTSLAFSSAVVLAVVGLLVYEQFVVGDRPPTIEVEPAWAELRQVGDLFYLPVVVANRGDQTAQDVRVRVRLASEPAAEPAELLIDYLVGGATARATVTYHQDPAASGVVVDRLSFREP
jgi:uncharacterized protein (TIGR02588 family)